jgi:hypothetical protein
MRVTNARCAHDEVFLVLLVDVEVVYVVEVDGGDLSV